MYNDEFRRLMSEMYKFSSKLSLFKKVTGESPARCFELPLAVTNLDMKTGEKLLDVGAGGSCFGLFMMIRKKVNVTVLDVDAKVMVNKKYLENLGMLTQPIKNALVLLIVQRMKSRRGCINFKMDVLQLKFVMQEK